MDTRTRIILGIIGAVIGVFCGLLAGKFNIYHLVNKKNTISYDYDPEYKPREKNVSGKIFGSMIGFLFMIIGIILLVCNFSSVIEDFETYGTLVAFGIFLTLFGGFIGFGVLFSKNN